MISPHRSSFLKTTEENLPVVCVRCVSTRRGSAKMRERDSKRVIGRVSEAERSWWGLNRKIMKVKGINNNNNRIKMKDLEEEILYERLKTEKQKLTFLLLVLAWLLCACC